MSKYIGGLFCISDLTEAIGKAPSINGKLVPDGTSSAQAVHSRRGRGESSST